MKLVALAALSLALVLAGCDGADETAAATPREPGPNSVGHYCGMTLAEHQGPKGQLLLKGRAEPLWFTSVRDALTYMTLDLANEGEIAGFWVNDMGYGSWDRPAPGRWIAASQALYVLGSNKTAAMGGVEAVPFGERAKAEAFAAEFGGRIVSYAEARKAVADSLTAQVAGENQ